MEEIKYHYEKLDEETGKIKYCPTHDLDGKITGRLIYGLKAWFDENPEERMRLGWTKHIEHETKEIEYNRQTQYLTNTTRQIDEFTVEDVCHVMDKSEEQLRLEELLSYGITTDTYDVGSSIIFV